METPDWDELEPIARRCAEQAVSRRAVSRRAVAPFLREQIVNDCVSHVWECVSRGAYNPSRLFEPWCRVVVERKIIDMFRSNRRQKDRPIGGDSEAVSTIEDNPSPVGQRALWVRGDQFSKADLDRVARQPVLHRVIVLCAMGMWLLVPQQIWDSWIAELNLSPPFPPKEFLDAEQIGDRQELLAVAFNLTKNAIQQHCCRCQPWLSQLVLIRRLRGEI